jgi:hypothetical protein
LYPVFKLFETIVILIHIIFLIPAGFLDVLEPFYFYLHKNYYLMFLIKYKVAKLLIKLRLSDRSILTDDLFFHTSLDLQKEGYVAPVCKNPVVVAIAYGHYFNYRKKYYYAGITPFSVNREAIDIYIVLRRLITGTRYQRKVFGFFDGFLVMFPYSYIMRFYFFFIVNVIRGFFYLIYIILIPLYPLIFLGVVLVASYELYDFYSLMFSKDFDLKLIRKRKREIRHDKIRNYVLS